MDTNYIIVTVCSIIITTIISSGVTKWRIEQLEKKVEKHNTIIERVYKLEQKVEDIEHE